MFCMDAIIQIRLRFQTWYLVLSSQLFGKEAFKRAIVVFLTIVDLLTFAYFLIVELITVNMILKSRVDIAGFSLRILAWQFRFWKS